MKWLVESGLEQEPQVVGTERSARVNVCVVFVDYFIGNVFQVVPIPKSLLHHPGISTVRMRTTWVYRRQKYTIMKALLLDLPLKKRSTFGGGLIFC